MLQIKSLLFIPLHPLKGLLYPSVNSHVANLQACSAKRPQLNTDVIQSSWKVPRAIFSFRRLHPSAGVFLPACLPSFLPKAFRKGWGITFLPSVLPPSLKGAQTGNRVASKSNGRNCESVDTPWIEKWATDTQPSSFSLEQPCTRF